MYGRETDNALHQSRLRQSLRPIFIDTVGRRCVGIIHENIDRLPGNQFDHSFFFDGSLTVALSVLESARVR